MKLNLTKEQIMGIVRHSLTFIGGLIVAFGWLEEGMWTTISGGIMTLVGGVWSIIDKNN